MSEAKYKAGDLVDFAAALFIKAGLAEDRARTVSRILVEGDLMGHATHGLQLLGPYLRELENGGMTRDGDPTVLSDRPAALTWDGNWLPGPWLVERAFAEAGRRAETYGMASVAIRRCQHIGCLAAYFPALVERGLFGILTCSDPETHTVIPHGGTVPLYSPNPIAAGFPTDAGPVIMDVSMSITTNGLCMRTRKEGGRLPGQWLKDASGSPTDDPGVVFADPQGGHMPLGGLDAGHKGFALALLVEALTSGLSGLGRAEGIDHWGATVYLQVMVPDAYAGSAAFTRETGWLAQACRDSAPMAGVESVRTPGQAAMARRADAMENGVTLYPGIMESALELAGKLGVTTPKAM